MPPYLATSEAKLHRSARLRNFLIREVRDHDGTVVGDIIVHVNKDTLLSSDDDSAASLLKSEGDVPLAVSNPNKSKEDEKKAESVVDGDTEQVQGPEKPYEDVSAACSSRELLPRPLIPSLKPQETSPSKSIQTMSPSVEANFGVVPTIEMPSATGTTSVPKSTSKFPITTIPATFLEIPHSLATIPILPCTSSSSTLQLSPSAINLSSAIGVMPPTDPATCEIKPGEETTIEINKELMGLRLSIVGGSDTPLGVIIIYEVYPGGSVAKDGRLKAGDQILQIDNVDFRSITHTKALAALRQTSGKVKVVVFRHKPSEKEEDNLDVIKIDLIKKPGRELGLRLAASLNRTGVIIFNLVYGGTAEADGRIRVGDRILAVNGHDLRSATLAEATAVLKTAMGKVTITVGRLKASSKESSSTGNTDKISNMATRVAPSGSHSKRDNSAKNSGRQGFFTSLKKRSSFIRRVAEWFLCRRN